MPAPTLIIGGGLVGSHVAQQLVASGETPIIMDIAPQASALGEIVDISKVKVARGDVLNPFDLFRIMREHEIRDVVHLAVYAQLTSGAQADPLPAVALNIMGTMHVLEAARTLKLGRIVVASSNVLGNFLTGGEGAGDQALEEAFPRPLTFYAATKQAIESLGLNYARWSGVDFVALRYGAVAGRWGGQGGGGPSNRIRGIVEACLAGSETTVPAARMEWVHVGDAARATLLALRARSLPNRVFNVTAGVVTDGEGLAAAVRAVFPGARLAIERESAATPPPMLRPSSLALANAQLGYAPDHGMVDIVRDVAAGLKRKIG